MEADELSELLGRSDTHRTILGNRRGPYSLGVTRSSAPKEGFALLLKIEDATGFPTHVNLSGKEVRLIVQGGFKPPKPLRTR
jgi:hypothetical protein